MANKRSKREFGTEACLVGKIAKRQMRFAGYKVRIKSKLRQPKRSESEKQGDDGKTTA